jgi:peptidoglycan/LPS O-acetylase OafA/YrhL
MRGIAALAVVQLHTHPFFGGLLFQNAGLAVDFFFMLSGFVISYAYQERLDQGWSTREFLKARIIRLYPLYALGLLFGTIFWAFRSHMGTKFMTMGDFYMLFVLAVLLLPAPSFVHSPIGASFPLNVPTWSLFFEVLANVMHALVFRRRSLRFLTTFTGVAALALIAACLRHGSIDCGSSQSDIALGVTRVVFAYPAGMLVFEVWNRVDFQGEVPVWLPIVILIGTLAGVQGGTRETVYDLCCMIAVFPVTLLLGAWSKPADWALKPTQWIGTSSYALYVLHNPVAWIFDMIAKRVLHHDTGLNAPWAGFVFLALILGMLALIDRFYDIPARAYLRRTTTTKTREVPSECASA